MCAVSFVSDYYQREYPKYFPGNPYPWRNDGDLRNQLKEVLERLDKIDKRLKDKECMDDKKKKFIKELGANIDA